jgi:hypothetical protein
MMGSPSELTRQQLKELGIKIEVKEWVNLQKKW